MNPIRRWLVDRLAPRASLATALDINSNLRARPGQNLDAQMYAWATGPRCEQTLAMYAYNNWVMTAENKLSSRAATAALQVQAIDDPMTMYEKHPMLELLGERGRPNDYQDSLEFWMNGIIDLDLAGNAYFYWFSAAGGAPTEVHLLEPYYMQVIPGASKGVAGYTYRYQGHEYRLSPEQVTHFKTPNPFNRYYGMSALEALRLIISSDLSMTRWNDQFFGDDVAVPAGAFIIPNDVSDADKDRFSDEINSRHAGRRRTAVLRAAPGSVAYMAAGIAPKDMDFTEGRMLSRKAVYEALELPLGLMSEASTEAHARVAERQLAETIRIRHTRIARKLTIDALPFWSASKLRKVDFEDLSLRAADWDRESKRLNAVRPFMTRNEVRTRILHLPPIDGWDETEMTNAAPEDAGQPESGRDTDSVQPEGQVRDVVGQEQQS
jgi:HK97 family phage portal protein